MYVTVIQIPDNCIIHHLRQLDVSKAVDERLAEPRQLFQQAVIVLLDHLVLFFDGLKVALHGRDLDQDRLKIAREFYFNLIPPGFILTYRHSERSREDS